jgi:hypothetical protein
MAKKAIRVGRVSDGHTDRRPHRPETIEGLMKERCNITTRYPEQGWKVINLFAVLCVTAYVCEQARFSYSH